MHFSARTAARRLVPGLTLAGALALGGCVGTSPYDRLIRAQPSGSAFSQALFHDYSLLARSFGIADAPSSTSFDATDSYSIASLDASQAKVADAYVDKALSAAQGEEPLPQAAPPDDQTAEALRMKLLRALDKGRAKTPELAARAQADYDCWIMNGTVDSLAVASAHCHAAFAHSLARLEAAQNIAPSLAGPAPGT